MAKQYIKQIDNQSFVYPNNDLAEYDIEIVHSVNENTITGSVTNFVSIFSGSVINVSFDYTWGLNGAEPFIREDGTMALFSVHMMEPSLTFYKPWNTIGFVTDTNLSDTTKTGHFVVNVYPSQFGLSSFPNGQFYFEIRFIGHREVIPISIGQAITSITPTATPTPSPTKGLTPTPTPTNTATPTPTPSNAGFVSIGTGFKISAPGSCTSIGNTPTIYLNPTDYNKFTSYGGCLSDGFTTISVIRNSDGTAISGTFYFVYNLGGCLTTTFKSTNGNITVAPQQC